MREVGKVIDHSSVGRLPGSQRQFNLEAIWDFSAPPVEVIGVGLDIQDISNWCGNVFLAIDALPGTGPINRPGQQVWAQTKGWMPYSFVFGGTVTAFEAGKHLNMAITGDFEGDAQVEVFPVSGGTRVRFTWSIDCRHRLLAAFSRVFPSLMVWNHSWAVGRACKSMQREIARRQLRSNITFSERPTFPHNIPFLNSVFSNRRQREITRRLRALTPKHQA